MNAKRLFALCALATTLGAQVGAAPNAAPYRVVVNSANAATSIGRDDLGRIFLKKATTWPAGPAAQPVDQATSSPVRKAFSQAVLGKDVDTVESYWQQAIFSGRAVPPPVKGSDAEVLAFVRANANAVGYVSGGAELGASVKELEVR
jgi:ABC-type phosphate transport system substrate-binding protein